MNKTIGMSNDDIESLASNDYGLSESNFSQSILSKNTQNFKGSFINRDRSNTTVKATVKEQKLAVYESGANSGRNSNDNSRNSKLPIERKQSGKTSLNDRASSDPKEDDDEYVDDFE